MKKGTFLLGLLISILSFAKAETLAERIAMNQNFLGLNEVFTISLQMPQSEKFIAEFDREGLIEGGNSYLNEISEIGLEEIALINNNICKYVEGLVNDFPELRQMSDDEIRKLIEEATNLHFKTNPDMYSVGSKFFNFKTCADCKREGRAKMISQTVLGGLAGYVFSGPFKVLGVWGGAVLGFWGAAEETLTCLKEYCR